jgi:hypothetical protein
MIDRKRTRRGSVMAELPVVCWVAFIIFAIPLINLTTIALRSFFFYISVQEATLEGSRARTFQIPIDGEPSAKGIVSTKLPQLMSGFSEVVLLGSELEIVITDINTGVQSTIAERLDNPGDSSKNLYELQVATTADIAPLVLCPVEPFADIPGVGKAFRVSLTSRHHVECPECWNL